MKIAQIEIYSFPKSKNKYCFEDIELIDCVFNLNTLGLSMSKLLEIKESGNVFHNDFCTIKFISPVAGMRVCRKVGIKTNTKEKVIQWESI